MSNIDIIEAASGRPFRFRAEGEDFGLPSPADLDYQDVLRALDAQLAPDMPTSVEISQWKQRLLFLAWAAHFDLPDFPNAQRLTYLLDRYRSALVYDVAHYTGADIAELWRNRRWRTALDLIDHLPAWSWYSSAVSGDEEHAQMIAESLAAREAEGEAEPTGPPLHTWTPEVAAITTLIDAVNHLTYVTATAAGDKKSKPPPPMSRPQTPLEAAMKRAAIERRNTKHQQLVARMLPHKAATTR